MKYLTNENIIAVVAGILFVTCVAIGSEQKDAPAPAPAPVVKVEPKVRTWQQKQDDEYWRKRAADRWLEKEIDRRIARDAKRGY